MLEKLKKTPLDHHVRVLGGSLSQALQNDIRSVGSYLDKRFYDMKKDKNLKKKQKKEKKAGKK